MSAIIRESTKIDAHLYLIVATQTIAYICYLPSLLYYGIKYYHHRNHVALKQRFAKITLFELVFTGLSTIFGSIWLVDYHTTIVDSPYFLLSGSASVLFCEGAVLSLWAFRFWMIIYSMKSAVAMDNQQ